VVKNVELVMKQKTGWFSQRIRIFYK